MDALISVIIPVYKVEEYLEDCIRSVIQQTYNNLEIILVDDGSPDRCPQICDSWAKKDSRVSVIHKENGGLSDARNAGLDHCHGDYIAFVDSDDWIKPQMFERMLHVIQSEDADICACGIENHYDDGHISSWKIPSLKGNKEKIYENLYHDTKYPVAAWNKLYKRCLWEQTRFPKGKLCEDAFTTYLLIDKAKYIVQIPDDLYCYRIRENSIMTSSFSSKRMDEEEAWRVNYQFMKKNYPSVAKVAFDFYLQKVFVLIHTIPFEKIDIYQNCTEYLLNILERNRSYVLFRSSLPVKFRIKYLHEVQKLTKVFSREPCA
ncbi:MAG: glycosyltransferase [Erysipelotrichaceae bacterium]|jgi:glycosyltransferase involved in cell wall biosynthesis|nr:glycosyltransferase [Erysipelotrichaceae bacterium]MCH4043677.1 glycosyltransferase [Erysipelotrichaceae bacterium]MCH4120896.1 glycosyltransferase [Erysipelotrichaceae bacterium]